MATKKYNPYDDVKAIVDLKAQYNEAKAKKQDYQQYQQQAVPYYQNLIANERGSIADRLAESDYTKASEILSEYQPTQPYQELYDTLSDIGTGEVKTADDSYTKWRDDLMGIGTGQVSPKASETVSGLVDTWTGNNADYTTLLNDLHGIGKEQLDYLNNFDYTKQSYFDPIMQTYQLYGDNAANGELASGAAANAGNIDSYAAANAARQQLAFTNAGHQAALAAAQQNQGNWQTLYNQMSGNVNNAGALNSQNLATIAGMYSTDSAERQAAMNTLASMYGTDSAERQNAINNAANLAVQEAVNEANKYIADVGYDQTVYSTDAQERIEKYLGDLGYRSDVAGYASQEAIAAANNAADYQQLLAQLQGEKEIASISNDAAYNQLLAQIQAEKDLAEQNAAAELTQTKYNNKNERTIREMELQNELDKIYTQNNLVRDTASYTADQVAADIYNAILSNDENFSDIKSFDDFASAVLQISGDPTATNKAVEAIKELHPNLFGGSASASGGGTHDFSSYLSK